MSQRTGAGQRDARRVAREDRREVEPEPVHVHLLHPVAEAVHDHPAHDRVIGVQRVARAGVVGVARAVFLEDVVRRVVEPSEAERRTALVALRGVVVHDVEDDLEPRAVQRLDHVAELVEHAERIRARAVRLVRREERHGSVPPVVDLAGRTVLGVELEHGQQLHRGDPELAEVRDLLDQSRERAARLGADARALVAGEAAHVQLVDDGPCGRAGGAARLPSQS